MLDGVEAVGLGRHLPRGGGTNFAGLRISPKSNGWCAPSFSLARAGRVKGLKQSPASAQLQRKTHDMTRLNGKTAVITGGATGIGLAAAKRFIEEGAFVFIFGRRQEALDAAVAHLGPNARAVKGSVSDEADLDRLYAAVKTERGTLDIVFANAGVGSQLALGKITAEHIDEIFDTNVKGTIFTVQKALPLMGKGGSIILTGSSAGTTGAPAFTAYSASKAAVRNLARTWAEDLKGTGIRVNVLSPGATATELAKEALGEEGLKAYGSMTALQRMGDPTEVGAAAAFLASSDSSFMTGSEVAVDGGLAQI
jgi:NAD(P)-dependent dehydrogenase (short-subunit alcohol dehydrogenase family)